MQPTLTLRVDDINQLDRLRCGELLKVGLPVGRSEVQVLEEVCRSAGSQPALLMDELAALDRRDPRYSVSYQGSLSLFPQAVGKSLYCFLQRNGGRSFYRLLLGLYH